MQCFEHEAIAGTQSRLHRQRLSCNSNTFSHRLDNKAQVLSILLVSSEPQNATNLPKESVCKRDVTLELSKGALRSDAQCFIYTLRIVFVWARAHLSAFVVIFYGQESTQVSTSLCMHTESRVFITSARPRYAEAAHAAHLAHIPRHDEREVCKSAVYMRFSSLCLRFVTPYLSPSTNSSNLWVANASLYHDCSFTLLVEVEQCLMAPIGPLLSLQASPRCPARLNANTVNIAFSKLAFSEFRL